MIQHTKKDKQVSFHKQIACQHLSQTNDISICTEEYKILFPEGRPKVFSTVSGTHCHKQF